MFNRQTQLLGALKRLLLKTVVILALAPTMLMAENVIFLSSAYVTGPWQQAIDREVSNLVRVRHGDLRVFREDLSYVTRQSETDVESLIHALNDKYSGLEISRVVAVGGHATSFIENATSKLFPGSVKYLVSDYKIVELGKDPSPRVIREADIPGESISLIKALLPQVDRVILVSSYPDADDTLQAFRAVAPTLEIELWGQDLTYSQVLDRAKTLPESSVIHYYGMPSDSTGEQKIVADFAEELSDASVQPVFVTFATAIGRGVLGGTVAEPSQTGKRVGQLLLNNYQPSDSLLAVEVDYQVMDRFNIDWERLPSDAIVINSPLSFMEDPVALTRYGLTLTLVLLLLLGFVVMRMLLIRARATRAEAHAAEMRLEKSKSQKLYGVIAHELRTPVSAIAMMAAEPDSEFIKRKADVRNATDTLLTTIDDMSLMVDPNLERPVRLSIFNLTEFNNGIASGVASLLASSGMHFEYHQDMSTERATALYLADAYRIRVAITNLIRNSCLHSEGSEVILTSRLVEQEGKLTGQWLVCDNGKGINSEDVERIFEAGERATSTSLGSGLGLYITRTWIGEIGGEVRYEPDHHAGSCFRLNVPLTLADAASEASPLSNQQDPSYSLKHFKVLMVEDEAMLRLLGTKLLSNLVSSVEVASNGEEGLEKFNSSYDLIVADYFMPLMDGAEMITAMREQGYTGIIIGVTAATIGDQMQDMYRAGADAVIDKPLNIEKFKTAVNKIMTERSSLHHSK